MELIRNIACQITLRASSAFVLHSIQCPSLSVIPILPARWLIWCALYLKKLHVGRQSKNKFLRYFSPTKIVFKNFLSSKVISITVWVTAIILNPPPITSELSWGLRGGKCLKTCHKKKRFTSGGGTFYPIQAPATNSEVLWNFTEKLVKLAQDVVIGRKRFRRPRVLTDVKKLQVFVLNVKCWVMKDDAFEMNRQVM